jgi:hypothetical protein
MRLAILVCLLLVASIECTQVEVGEITMDDYIKMVKGLLEGMNVKHDMDKIVKCMDHVPDIVHLVMATIEKIKHIDFKNIEIKLIVELIVQIVGAVREIIQSILPCADSSEEFKKLIEKFSSLTFDQIMKNVMGNIFLIIADLGKIQEAVNKAQYEDLGKAIGDILFLIFLKS